VGMIPPKGEFMMTSKDFHFAKSIVD